MAALILAAVTAFYDEQRQHARDFFIYPDYFIFHVNCKPGNYSMFDVWPEHKCVSVEGDAEEVLRAVNDRGISVLVLDEQAERGRPSPLQPHTRNSALSRIRQAFLCLPPEATGQPGADGTVTITGNAVVERYVHDVIDQTNTVTGAEREAVRARRRRLDAAQEGRGTERYRCVPPEKALNHL
jgi:hypothetical protein